MSNLYEFDEELEICDGDVVIYPYPYGYPFYQQYDYDHLVQFSKISIEKFNKDEGTQFEFVELLQGRLFTCEIDSVKTYFKVRDPDGMIITLTTFTDCPHNGPLSPPVLVSPLTDSEEKMLQGLQPSSLSESDFELKMTLDEIQQLDLYST